MKEVWEVNEGRKELEIVLNEFGGEGTEGGGVDKWGK